MPDFTARRTMMVDTQIRPSDVTKFPIIDAMLSVPREAYLPKRLQEAAYVGEALDLGDGRTLLEPRTFAKMLDALEIERDHSILDIGCGLGYSTAVLAHMAKFVVGIEDDTSRAAEAQTNLSSHEVDNAVVIEAPLADGHAKSGPFDIIFMQGAVEVFPEALAAQLHDGGRVAAIFMEGALGTVQIGHKIDGRIVWRFEFNASASVLEGFAKPKAFAL